MAHIVFKCPLFLVRYGQGIRVCCRQPHKVTHCVHECCCGCRAPHECCCGCRAPHECVATPGTRTLTTWMHAF
eukprot:361760-Chlamydomonas_euryale.AAC.3